MTQRNILRWSERTIDEAIIELTFGRYQEAEQKFETAANELNDKTDSSRCDRHYTRYFRVASFGQGLAQGMKEYDESNKSGEPRRVWKVAEAAKNFYDAQMSYLTRDNNPNRYRDYYTSLGKHYALLGLGNEGLKVLEASRHSSVLLCKLGPHS